MAVYVEEWTGSEQSIAEKAFHSAYEREITALTQEVKHRSHAIEQVEDIWRLHDFLSARRHQIDGKYDYNYEMLIFTFAGLLKDGWLSADDLEGLARDKLAKITSLSRM